MTTPGLTTPPDGAFVFGGGPYRYGQEYSEGRAAEIFSLPKPTNLTEAKDAVRDILRMAPTGALDSMTPLLEGRDEDDFEGPDITADTFMGALEDKPNLIDRIQQTWDTIVKGLTGANQSGFDINALFDSAAAQKREMDRMQAGLAQLQADQTANNNSGRTFQVAVSQYSGVPSVFTPAFTAGSGTVTNDGDTLEMSNDDLLVMYRYNVSDLLTDYFEVSLVVPRQAWDYLGNFGERSLFFIGRANIGFTNLVFARLNGRKVSVGCVNGGLAGGTYTYFGSGGTGTGPTEVTINRGSYMTFRGGTVAGARVFQFLVGNEVVATFVDTASSSLMGDLYRWTGFGIWNDAGPDAINRVPNMSHFVANDNKPAPVLGSGARMSRLTTSNIGVNAGDNLFPSGFFGFTNIRSEDIASDPANAKFTVQKAGFYVVHAQCLIGPSWVSHWLFQLYINGLPDITFGTDLGFISNALGGTIKPDTVGASTVVYLEANQSIQLGYTTPLGTVNALTGESTGNYTYWSITRIPE